MKSGTGGRADWLAPVGTIMAILACYGTLAIIGILSLMGVALAIDEGLWAGAIVIFALLALAGIVLGWRSHRSAPPLLLGVLGAGMVIWTMTIGYSRPLEIAGLACLAAAALLDWRAKRSHRTAPGVG